MQQAILARDKSWGKAIGVLLSRSWKTCHQERDIGGIPISTCRGCGGMWRGILQAEVNLQDLRIAERLRAHTGTEVARQCR